MQPYFLPYIGYWQLLKAVDVFIVYDNIQYSKEGWINRNRILTNDAAALFSLPLKKASDYLDIIEKSLADSFAAERHKILKKIDAAYRKAPFFKDAMPAVEKCFGCNDCNLFRFIHNSIMVICEYMHIHTPIVISSHIETDHSLKAADRVIALCRSQHADQYINPIGGLTLYSKADFATEGIDLKFIQTAPLSYKQFDNQFVPNLSIIDVLMFNSKDHVTTMLGNYELL